MKITNLNAIKYYLNNYVEIQHKFSDSYFENPLNISDDEEISEHRIKIIKKSIEICNDEKLKEYLNIYLNFLEAIEETGPIKYNKPPINEKNQIEYYTENYYYYRKVYDSFKNPLELKNMSNLDLNSHYNDIVWIKNVLDEKNRIFLEFLNDYFKVLNEFKVNQYLL